MMEMPQLRSYTEEEQDPAIDELIEETREHSISPKPRSHAEATAHAVLELLRKERVRSRIVVKSERRLLFVRQDEIDWVEAAGNYVRLHVRGEAHVLRQSMKNMEARLDPSIFVRIHRSAIVNADRIRELQPWLHGEYVVILADGTRLSASRVFSDRLDALIS
jgi:two-component system, LytTR family, response regulator